MVKWMRTAAACGLCAALSGAGCGKPSIAGPAGSIGEPAAKLDSTDPGANMNEKLVRTDPEWKQQLTPEQYRVLREKGTERAFTGAYWNHHEPGVYRCAGCGQELFGAETKYDSGCGWPSFSAPADTNRVSTQADDSLGMQRTEVLCARCGGHLGHVFDDGPKPTGLRYCINSASLSFAPRSEAKPTQPSPSGQPSP